MNKLIAFTEIVLISLVVVILIIIGIPLLLIYGTCKRVYDFIEDEILWSRLHKEEMKKYKTGGWFE